jgi:phage terminase large subunit
MVNIRNVLSPHFFKFWVASKKKEHLRYVLKGGRGSGKSFTVPMRIVMDIIEYPISALAMRKVQNTIAKSVFQNFKAAAMLLGVYHLFKFVPSNLEITYLPRGNKIYFAGADDPNKIKSVKDAEFPLAILWIEELAEFKTEDEVTTIENSVLREELEGKIHSEAFKRKVKYGFDYSFYYTYNPPKRRQSWVNKKYESAFVDKNTFVDHSTYLDNPHLSKKFVEEAENVKANKPMKYRWEYMGEAIGSGIVPFDNLVFETIPDDLFSTFDNIRQGNDFGYATDPNAFVRWHYDVKKNGIYAMDEIYGVKMSLRELAKQIKAKGYERQWITADGAEPRSIDELKIEHGIKRIKGAKKGADSVEYGEEWLDDLNFIHIDPKRTPNIAREFENIDYATDKNGDTLPRLEDKDNHTIDSTRYAFEDDMKTAKRIVGGRSLTR